MPTYEVVGDDGRIIEIEVEEEEIEGEDGSSWDPGGWWPFDSDFWQELEEYFFGDDSDEEDIDEEIEVPEPGYV